MAISRESLGKLLVKEGVLTGEQLKSMEEESARTGVEFQRLLIAQGNLSQSYLNELISKYLNVPLFDIRSKPLETEIVSILPETVARERQVLLFEKNGDTFRVAMADPTNVETLNFLREYLKGNIEPYLTTPEDLRFGYRVYKRKTSQKLEMVIAEKIKELSRNALPGENILESVPLIELFETILDYAAILNASDVYFQPEEDILKVRIRVDGMLKEIISVNKSLSDGVVARVKTLAALKIDEHMRPQDGRFRFRSGNMDLDIRAAVMPTFFGEKITLRLLAGSQLYLSFDELGMSHDLIMKLQTAVKKSYGMILSSGPTGSGKTTTIYGILNVLNRPEVHITTIEDPVEYIVPNVSQTQVNVQAGITFASGLRALMRHSPDIIFIGEIRDDETANIATNAALTGHLLISTIHTNDAPGAVIRLINLGIPPFIVNATVEAVIAQRLIRKICLNCIASYPPPPAVIDQIKKELARRGQTATMPSLLFRGKGCAICGQSGYEGRTGLFEIFLLDENTKKILSEGEVTTEKVMKAARDQGMVSMFQDGVEKIGLGITTIEEVLRAISE